MYTGDIASELATVKPAWQNIARAVSMQSMQDTILSVAAPREQSVIFWPFGGVV